MAAATGFTALGGLCFLAGALLLLPRHRTPPRDIQNARRPS
jgi:hypothetical protein